MLKNKKRILLNCFTLISTVFLILQPYELTFTDATSENGSSTSPYSVAQDSEIQQHELQGQLNE